MNLRSIKSIHFTGIKGVGMTALALCAKDLGKKISGSDLAETFPTDKILKKRGIKIKIGFNKINLPLNCQLVIHTGAHGGSTNPEVIIAKKRNIPTLNHAQALKLFSNTKQVLAVAGVGGKSTTSAMLATLLTQSGFNPSFAVGVGDIFSLNTPGRFNKKSDYFVIEADEYVADPTFDLTPRFHYLNPFIAIITNLEHDHPDVYPDLGVVIKAYLTFISQVSKKGAIIVNIDNPRIKNLINKITRPVITYGFSPQADWQVLKTHVAKEKQFFTLKHNSTVYPDFVLNCLGNYNVLNATAAIAAADFLRISIPKLQQGIKAYSGTKRRFEFIKEIKSIRLYDDYAHHPTEIKAVLSAAKDWLPGRRLIVIFQSHTYSRTKTLLKDFANSFNSAHQVIINEIFSSARETDTQGINGQILTGEIKKHQSQVFFCPDKQATLKHLKANLQKKDCVITLGAGDNWLWHKDILKTIKSCQL